MKKRTIAAMLILTLALTLFSTAAAASPSILLKRGSSGEQVRTLQTYLVSNGYSLVADGRFGPMTESAVRKYQASAGLAADGIVGPATWKRLVAVEHFIAIAKTRLGYKYVLGGKGPNVFDCSGFVYWSLNQAGVNQPYMTSSAWQTNTKYRRISSMSGLMRGDIVSFKGHVGIYLGSGQMINALNPESGVCITGTTTSYWTSNFVSGFRVF